MKTTRTMPEDQESVQETQIPKPKASPRKLRSQMSTARTAPQKTARSDITGRGDVTARGNLTARTDTTRGDQTARSVLLPPPPVTSPPLRQDAASKLDSMLECAICRSRYHQPKLLTCQHTFCQVCLDSIIDNQSQVETSNKIRCPVCRSDTKLPKGGVAKLQGNVTIQTLLDLQLPSQDALPEEQHDLTQCGQCGSRGKLQGCVLHCNKMLCVSCLNAHGKQSRESTRKLVNSLKLDAGRIQLQLAEWESHRHNLLASHKQMKMDSDDYFDHAISTLKKLKGEVIQRSDKLVLPYLQGMEAVTRHLNEHIQDLETMTSELEDYVLQKGQFDQWQLLRTRYEAQMKHTQCQNVGKQTARFFTGDLKYRDRLVTKIWYRYPTDHFDDLIREQRFNKITFMSKPFNAETDSGAREANY